jgi:protocatechuate 3,4-dioxygenase beta subunit
MNVSRPLLLLIAGVLAIGLALFVVLSPDVQSPSSSEFGTDSPSSSESSKASAATHEPDFAPGFPARAQESQREAAPELKEVSAIDAGARARVSLRVLNQDGKPIEGASMRGASLGQSSDFEMLGFLDWDAPDSLSLAVFGDSVSTEDGHLQLSVPTETRFLLELGADGFATAMRDCQPMAVDQELKLGDIRLQEGGELRIEVQDSQGRPLPGLSVLAWSGDEDPRPRAGEFPVRDMLRCATDENGLAHFRGLPKLPAADFEIWGEKLQSPSSIEMLGPQGDEARHQRYILPPANRVRGRVVDPNGDPIEKAKVLVLDPSQSFNWVDLDGDDELEEVLKQRPGLGSELAFGLLDLFDLQETDADGRFEQEYFFDPEKAHGQTLLFAAVAIIEDSLVVESTFHRAEDELTLVIPRTRRAFGRVLDPNQLPIVGVQLHFRVRIDLAPDETEAKDDSGVGLMDRSAIECDSEGKFSAQLPEERYWIEAVYPGGRFVFEGPYPLRESDLDLGDLEIPTGRSVELIALPKDGSEAIQGLRGMRELPEDEQDDLDMFMAPPPAIEDDSAELAWKNAKAGVFQQSQPAEVRELTARWHNEMEGTWEYALTAPGWVPAFVTLELEAETPPTRLEVPMTRAGEVIVHVLTANGEAPKDLILELVPARDSATHPLYERRASGNADENWFDHDRLPVDAASQAHFKQVLPGQYEVFAMSNADADNWFSPDSENRVAIANLEVLAGATVEVDASIANLAELTVLVLRNGAPVEGAQVFAENTPEQFGIASQMFGFNFGGNEPQGITNAQGQIVLSSLTPGGRYQVGARLTALDEDDWQESDAWTHVFATLTSGPQSITVELGAGGVRLQVNGDPGTEIEVRLAHLPAVPTLAEDASEEEKHFLEVFSEHRASQTQEGLFDMFTVATRVTQGGTTVEFRGLQAGPYQVMLETEAGNARGFSTKFEVADRVIDLGAVGMLQLGRVEIQLLGTEQLNEENRWTLDLACIPSGSEHAVESSGWLSGNGKLSWHLPAGSYFLQLSQHNKVLGSSPAFSVSSGSTTPFVWQIPTIQTGG